MTKHEAKITVASIDAQIYPWLLHLSLSRAHGENVRTLFLLATSFLRGSAISDGLFHGGCGGSDGGDIFLNGGGGGCGCGGLFLRSGAVDSVSEFGMLLLARRSRKAVMVKAQASLLQKRGGATAELAILAHFRCPISLDLMRDLVMATMGITYDREGIEAWLDTGRAVCPVTHAPLWLEDLVPNHAIRHVIQDWCVANRSHGVERIPTPKIPATPIQASEMLFNVAEFGAVWRGGARHRAVAPISATSFVSQCKSF
uniref:U-box domain-containing protein n=1 Tax=Oryza glumipatula TaxID=40148 RepID=A0A0E0BRQ7_9ORYZ